jgi:uncharacterized protein YndB with AHSA1/START domain
MRENKVKITINRPVEEVFEFTTNPKNTHLWIPSIQEELADEFPPKIGTQYKNRGESFNWDFYRVMEYHPPKIFTLSDLNGDYHVRYTYKKLDDNTTEMEYFEWMEHSELKNPFTQDILDKLRSVMESS